MVQGCISWGGKGFGEEVTFEYGHVDEGEASAGQVSSNKASTESSGGAADVDLSLEVASKATNSGGGKDVEVGGSITLETEVTAEDPADVVVSNVDTALEARVTSSSDDGETPEDLYPADGYTVDGKYVLYAEANADPSKILDASASAEVGGLTSTATVQAQKQSSLATASVESDLSLGDELRGKLARALDARRENRSRDRMLAGLG